MAGTFLTNALILVLGTATGILTARILHPDGRGLLAAVLFWPSLLASLCFLSLNEALTYRVGKLRGQAARAVPSALVLTSSLALVVVLVTWLAIPALLGTERQSAWNLARAYALLFVPFNYVTLVALAVDQGRLRFRPYNVVRMMVPALYATGLVALWLTNRLTVTSAVIASLIAVVFTGIAQIRRVGSMDLRGRVSSDELRNLLLRGLSFHSLTALLIISVQADRLVVLRFFDDVTVGYYVVAYSLAAVGPGTVGAAYHSLLFPQLANVADSADPAAGRLLSAGIRSAMLSLVVVGTALELLAPWLIVILFGRDYEPALQLTRILIVACVLYYFRDMISRSLRGLGESRIGFMAELVGLATFLGLTMVLSPLLGAEGVAMALVASSLPALAILIRYLVSQLGLRPADLWGLNWRTLRPLVLSFCRLGGTDDGRPL